MFTCHFQNILDEKSGFASSSREQIETRVEREPEHRSSPVLQGSWSLHSPLTLQVSNQDTFSICEQSKFGHNSSKGVIFIS